MEPAANCEKSPPSTANMILCNPLLSNVLRSPTVDWHISGLAGMKIENQNEHMKKTMVIAGTMAVCLAGAGVKADEDILTYNSDEWFRAQELSVGGFGMGTVGERTLDHFDGHNITRHGRLGLGADVDYFFLRYVGIEAEAWSENPDHSFVNDVGGNLVLRLPIESIRLAPYAFGGAGHSFVPVAATYGDFGAGVEFRFTHHIGIFVDGRYVVPDRLGNYGLGRAGIRFSF